MQTATQELRRRRSSSTARGSASPLRSVTVNVSSPTKVASSCSPVRACRRNGDGLPPPPRTTTYNDPFAMDPFEARLASVLSGRPLADATTFRRSASPEPIIPNSRPRSATTTSVSFSTASRGSSSDDEPFPSASLSRFGVRRGSSAASSVSRGARRTQPADDDGTKGHRSPSFRLRRARRNESHRGVVSYETQAEPNTDEESAVLVAAIAVQRHTDVPNRQCSTRTDKRTPHAPTPAHVNDARIDRRTRYHLEGVLKRLFHAAESAASAIRPSSTAHEPSPLIGAATATTLESAFCAALADLPEPCGSKPEACTALRSMQELYGPLPGDSVLTRSNLGAFSPAATADVPVSGKGNELLQAMLNIVASSIPLPPRRTLDRYWAHTVAAITTRHHHSVMSPALAANLIRCLVSDHDTAVSGFVFDVVTFVVSALRLICESGMADPMECLAAPNPMDAPAIVAARCAQLRSR
jgi:hypothetical protein